MYIAKYRRLEWEEGRGRRMKGPGAWILFLAGQIIAGDFEAVEGAEQGEGEAVVVEQAVGEALDVVAGDGVDFGGDLVN